MNIRDRIADWITGGGLTHSRERAQYWNKRWDEACGHWDKAEEDVLARGDALSAILTEAARDPSRPSIKRIARIAREALE